MVFTIIQFNIQYYMYTQKLLMMLLLVSFGHSRKSAGEVNTGLVQACCAMAQSQ